MRNETAQFASLLDTYNHIDIAHCHKKIPAP